MRKMIYIISLTGLVSMMFSANADFHQRTLPQTHSGKAKTGYRINNPQMTLWSQIPTDPANSAVYAVQLDSVYPYEADLVDDIETSSEQWIINTVRAWMGGWSGFFTGWANVINMHFLVYEDSGLVTPHPVDSPFVELIIEPADYTVTDLGNYRYIIDMALPVPLVLPSGHRYWIECQPTNVYSVNGSTGWQGEIGIGNGQEAYMRHPLLGYDTWQTASSVWIDPIECGFGLIGNLQYGNILFVDDDAGNGYEVYFEASLTNLGYTYDKWVVSDSGDVAPTAVQMAAYSGVIWSTGYDWSTTLTPTDTTEIGTYLAGGGWFWLSSQDVLYDIGSVGWMHLGGFDNDVGCTSVTGVGTVMSGLSFATTGGVFTDYSDTLVADNTSWIEIVNQTSAGNSVAHEDWGCKFYFNAFAFENINNEVDRDSMMARIFNRFFWWWPPWGDVGSFAFLSPGTMVSPGFYDVIGVVRNYGTEEDTFDVHCVVTDPTFAVVLDTTINVMTPAGENDTINFGYVDFTSSYTYDLYMATLLATDMNPSNDTLFRETYCTTDWWESFADMPTARSGPYAGWYCYNYDYYVHVFGGNPGPSADHYIWEEATNTWSYGTPLPLASCYGGHVTIGDRIYMIGARTGSDVSIVIYDAPADSYTTVAIPYGTIGDPAVAVYQNRYIYSIGGCRPSGWTATTIVFAYDTYADTFFEPTQLPAADARTCACAAYLDNDTIYVAGGIDASGIYTNEFLTGYIDPADPADITWSHGPDKPGSAVYRLNGHKILYEFCIAGGDAGGSYVKETHMYIPNTGWITQPDKITGVSNWACATIPYYDYWDCVMYAAGGYSPYQAVFEGFHVCHFGIQENPDDGVTAFAFTVSSSNPVTDRAVLAFSMPSRSAVDFSVYDVTGRKVLSSSYSNISRGEHSVFWDLRDNTGKEVSAGTYFYTLTTGEHTASGKLVVVR